MLHKQRSPASPPVIATLALASPSPRKCLYLKYFFLASVPHQSECGVGRQPMADPSYIFFNKSLLQCRSLGARGGRAYGRNQRARRARIALLPTPPAAVPFPAPPQETTATAIALLDARFPWLRCAERRHSGGTSLHVGACRAPVPGEHPEPCDPTAGSRRQDADGTENTLRRGLWTLTKR